jgi:hypothetical protein
MFSKYVKDFYRCTSCDHPCHVIETDVGCYEEFWGQQVWHEQYDLQSECCDAEVEEMTAEEVEEFEDALDAEYESRNMP